MAEEERDKAKPQDHTWPLFAILWYAPEISSSPPSACSPFATTVTLVATSQGWLFCVITTILWQRIVLKRFKTDESQITLSRERKWRSPWVHWKGCSAPTGNFRHPVLFLWPYAVDRMILNPAFCVEPTVCDVILVALIKWGLIKWGIFCFSPAYFTIKLHVNLCEVANFSSKFHWVL